ncbi:ER membrane protein complex subunit 5 [Cyberlindnera fabianii]|uniref:ER membrane protein complex subunit 5 n=1 Tax=Cyberlindnera fabianii TaxID=36022 RepID=A0A1V2L3A8_CYBFA|nr:ER membrane protein complex subunit 5 [Cyberlindnera fabianii]
MPAILPSIATLSLFHALYSSYEFTHLNKTHATTALAFPVDIQLEVTLSLVLYLLHFFLLSGRHTELSLVDNGRVLKKSARLTPVAMKDAVAWDELKGGNVMFKGIETRVTYLDIAQKRKEFQEWEKSNEKSVEKTLETSEETSEQPTTLDKEDK